MCRTDSDSKGFSRTIARGVVEGETGAKVEEEGGGGERGTERRKPSEESEKEGRRERLGELGGAILTI
jgi:hypothetical protein